MLDQFIDKRVFVRLYHAGVEFEMTGILRQSEWDKSAFSLQVEKRAPFASRCGFDLSFVKEVNTTDYLLPCITLW